jgi:hypothetical protein
LACSLHGVTRGHSVNLPLVYRVEPTGLQVAYSARLDVSGYIIVEELRQRSNVSSNSASFNSSKPTSNLWSLTDSTLA